MKSQPAPWYRNTSLDRLLVLLFIIAGTASVVATQRGIGPSWDETVYFVPGENALRWFRLLCTVPACATSAADINHFLGTIHELPMVPKAIFAFGLWLQPWLDIDMPHLAMRLPVALCYGLTLGLMFLIGQWFRGRLGGLLAVICYASLPRVFGHAHIAATETILVCTGMLFVWCFMKGLDNWKWSVATGLVFGLCLATKFNALFLPVPLLVWTYVYRRPHFTNNVFALIMLALPAMLLVWPYLWPDPAGRFVEYLRFFVNHKNISVFFRHQQYDLAPSLYVWTVFATCVPTVILLLGATGIGASIRHPRKNSDGILWLLCMLTPLMLSSLPTSPRYDGERLFVLAFPFLALLATLGMLVCLDRLKQWLQRFPLIQASWVTTGACVVLALYGVVGLWRVHPYEANYWSELIGEFRGAQRNGMETAYWGESFNEDVCDYLNALPPGTRVNTLAILYGLPRYLQEWGWLNKTLRFNSTGEPDIYLLQMRQGVFDREAEFLWEIYHSGKSGQALVQYQGVPLLLAFDVRQNSELQFKISRARRQDELDRESLSQPASI